MKLITLNIWGGQIFEPLTEFLKRHSDEVDIFCFQEMFNNPPDVPSKASQATWYSKIPRSTIYSDIKAILPQHESYIHPTQDNEESLAMFVRNTIPISKIEEVYVYRWKNAMENDDPSTYGINLEYLQFQQEGKQYTICNLHGHWTPNNKNDTPARLEQSKNIKKFLNSIEGAKILCGDFNTAPDTESMKILEEGMKNLIKENGVISTRSQLYKKEGIKFADYILVSPEIDVKDFKVLQDQVSDHLPLYLDFA